MRIGYTSFRQWYREGRLAPHVQVAKSPGGVLDLMDATLPAGDLSAPAVPDLVLHQVIAGGGRIAGDLGGGAFDVASERNRLLLAAPHFASTVFVDRPLRLRTLAFPLQHWASMLDEASSGHRSLDVMRLPGGPLQSAAICAALRNLWTLCDEDGVPTRLLARAAGCEILAELCRSSGSPLAPTTGGLARWMQRRSLELMRERLAEDISLDELAAEAGLSVYHFARMFKQSIGAPPRVHFTRLRVEKACELLATTDLSITQVALEVGYSSSQVLARVFDKWRGVSPSEYRRIARERALPPESLSEPG